MEKNDAQPAADGSNLRKLSDLELEITAQFAILDSAIRLINQHHPNGMKKTEDVLPRLEWVYNMAGLEKWVHLYTERKRLTCPKCKADTTVKCEICGEVYEYHDEL